MTAETLWDGALAIAVLVALDLGNLNYANFGMPAQYNTSLPFNVAFPERKRFVMAKVVIGSVIVAGFAAQSWVGDSNRTPLGLVLIGLIIAFGVISAWERVAAFRHYASTHLPPVDRDGYIRRWDP